MATYVNNLRLKEITTGDEDGTWGTSTNTNLELITDGFSYGTKEIAADANETFTMPDATADATRSLYLKFTSAVDLTATREITLGPNTVSKTWIIENATTGGQIITIKQGSGATVDVANGSKVMVVTDGAGAGAAVLNANPTEVGGTVTSVGGTGTVQGLTLSGTVTSSGNLTLGGSLAAVDLTSQVTGNLPLANGGTGASLVDPDADRIFFWDDSAGSTAFLTVGSGLQISGTTLSSTDAGGTVTSVAVSGGTTGLTTSGGPVTTSGTITLAGTLAVANGGTGVTTSTGTGATVLSTSPTLVTPALGTPASGVMTNATGLPLTTGVTGTLPVANGGTGVTTSTGTGATVLSTSPTLVTPVLGTPSSGTLSSCTVDGTDAVGFRNIPQNSQSAAYTLVLADAGKHIFHPAADNTARTFTIPANASVAYPVGTAITFINMAVADVTIAITSDTLTLSDAGTTGSRTLATNGSATCLKITSTQWIISGSGLT